MISNNNLSDESIKYLAECICTLKQLTFLDLSFNNITDEGVRILISIFEKSNRPICQLLDHIDLSSNPIANDGFINVCKLGQYVRLKVLKVNNCKITSNVFNDNNKPIMNFDNLEVLDISNNDLGHGIVSSIVSALNPNVFIELDLENVGVDGSICGVLAQFMDSAKHLKIRRFNLSNCKLTDSQFMRIFRYVF